MNFLKYRYVALIFSLLIIIGGITYGLVSGFRFDIDFKGGVAIETDLKQEFDNNDISDIVVKITGKAPLVQKTTGGENRVTITTENISTDIQDQIIAALKEKYTNMEEPSTRNVTAAYGKDLVTSAILAVSVSIVLILLYICIRFKTLGVTAAISAILALIHDVAFLIAIYGIFKFPINSVFIAVVLTIVGYSINDTIVIYDRIRENKRKISLSHNLEETINLSLSQTMRRTLFTSITTVSVIIIMLILAYVNGQQVLMQFSLPLCIGVIVGTYSSVFIAAPIWYMMSKKTDKATSKK